MEDNSGVILAVVGVLFLVVILLGLLGSARAGSREGVRQAIRALNSLTLPSVSPPPPIDLSPQIQALRTLGITADPLAVRPILEFMFAVIKGLPLLHAMAKPRRPTDVMTLQYGDPESGGIVDPQASENLKTFQEARLLDRAGDAIAAMGEPALGPLQELLLRDPVTNQPAVVLPKDIRRQLERALEAIEGR